MHHQRAAHRMQKRVKRPARMVGLQTTRVMRPALSMNLTQMPRAMPWWGRSLMLQQWDQTLFQS